MNVDPGTPAQSRPAVSVLMGMYNCADTLGEAIESILGQTLADWELVACDDGSTDGTWEVAQAYAARARGKLVLLKNASNLGLAASLNLCLEASLGTFIARQDGDDLSVPDRFQKQVSFLEQHPEYGWVSAGMTAFVEGRDVGSRFGKPVPTSADLIRSSCFAHAPTMFRRAVLEAVGGYRAKSYTRRTEDYDLWMRLFGAGLRGYNLQEPLYRVREDQRNYARKSFVNRIDEGITRFHGYRAMRAPPWAYAYVLRPIAIGMIPLSLLRYIHEWRLKKVAR